MRTFTFTFNSSAKQKVWKDRKTLTREELEKLFSTTREEDRKDGACFIPGGLIGTERKANAIEFIDALVYDVDGWQTLEELDKIVDATGVYAVIYSSHSHLTTKTDILVDHYIRWAKRQGRPEREPTEEELLDYLRDPATRKAHLKNPKCDLVIRQTADGQIYTVEHDPVPKFRVVFPLKTSMRMSDLGIGSQSANAAFKSIYHGVGQALGLDYDRACEDPSRLYYTPSHKPGAEYVIWQFLWDKPNPDLLDWEAYPRAAVVDKTKKVKADGSTKKITRGDRTVLDKNNVPIDLSVWESKNYDFDIEALLESVLDDDMIKSRRDRGGFHITCPFEHEHSTTGGQGTFCANGDGDYSWKIYCMHDACNGRSRTDYIEELIKQGFITAEDLGIAPVAEKPVEDPRVSEATQAVKSLGLQLHTLAPVIFEGETTEALTEFEDKPLEGDDALSADEVYAECLTALLGAKTESEIRATFGRMRYKRCGVLLDEIAEMLAKSEVSGNSCLKQLRSFILQLGEDPAEAMGYFSTCRQKIRNLAEWVKEAYDSALTGASLEMELRRMATFYGYPFREMRERFNAHQETLIREEIGNNITKKFAEMRQRYAKLRVGSSVFFIDMVTTRKNRAPSILNKSALATLLENQNEVQFTEKGKPIRYYVFDEWAMRDRDIKEYEKVTYIPRGATEVLRSDAFNVWDETENYGFCIDPRPGDCSLITNHIRDVWCSGNETLYNWVITWLAHIIQVPGDKPPSAIVLLGPPGTGKSIIFEYGLSRILGEGMYWKSAKRDDIVGKFNAHAVGKLLTLAEEILFAGDKRGMQQLKDSISSRTVDVEPKGVDKFQMPSYTRYAFTSNSVHALHLESEDRRFCILDTSIKHMQDTEYFTNMKEYLQGEGAHHLFHFLWNWKPEEVGLTWRSLNEVPKTEARAEQVVQTYTPADEFFYELLTEGRIISMPRELFDGDHVFWPFEKTPDNEDRFFIETTALKRLFGKYVRYHSKNHEFETKKFRECFKRFVGHANSDIEKVRVKKREDGTRLSYRAVLLPERRECLEDAHRRRIIRPEDYMRACSDKTTKDPETQSEVI